MAQGLASRILRHTVVDSFMKGDPMVLLYGMLRIVAAALRQLASWKHARIKRLYERSELAFAEVETDCKGHEVRMGRPVDYRSQLRLLKAFEAKEAARMRWLAALKTFDAWKRRETWLKDVSGKKLPYSFGLVDMALLMTVVDRRGLPLRLDVVSLAQSLWARF
jgi:hypothetical protein